MIEATSKIYNVLESNHTSYTSADGDFISTDGISALGITYRLPRPNMNNTLNFFLKFIRSSIQSGIGRMIIITSRAIPIPPDMYASLLILTHLEGIVLFHAPAGKIFSMNYERDMRSSPTGAHWKIMANIMARPYEMTAAIVVRLATLNQNPGKTRSW